MRFATPCSAAALIAVSAGLASPTGPTASAVAPSAAFRLADARAQPRQAFFDARNPVVLSYRFRAPSPTDVKIQLVSRDTGKVIRGWVEVGAQPGHEYEQRWSGVGADGDTAPNGSYKFVVRPAGAARAAGSAKFRFHQYEFPIPGPHSYREGVGDFGAPRDGGRVHQGKDVWASCGQTLVAARGGRVQQRGFDAVLYGNYVLIDARKTKTDFFYAHMLHPADVADGARVRTGDAIGEIGATGNAETVGCMMHIEMWPSGYHHGGPIDPEPYLREWDGWS